MKHLTIEEMIDFVSFHDMKPETLALASRVAAHVLVCESCREKVEAFQKIYDEFVRTDSVHLNANGADDEKQEEIKRRFGNVWSE